MVGRLGRALALALAFAQGSAWQSGCGAPMPTAHDLAADAGSRDAPPSDGGPLDLWPDLGVPARAVDTTMPPDLGVPPDPPPGCTARRTSAAVVQDLGFFSHVTPVYVTKSGGTIARGYSEVVLFDGGQTVRVPTKGPVSRSAFGGDLLAVNVGADLQIYSDELTLERSMPMVVCRAMGFIDARRLVCAGTLEQAPTQRWRVYDVVTGTMLNENTTACQVPLKVPQGSTWTLRPLGASHMVLARKETHEALALLEVKADNSVHCLCTGPETGAWVTEFFVVDQAAKQLILAEGDVLDAFGSSCTAGSADYFSLVGPAQHGGVPLLDRSDPLKKEFFVALADDGQTLAGLVDNGSVPYFHQCETHSCQLVTADVATRQRLQTVSLPPLPLHDHHDPFYYVPARAAYSPTCRYLAVAASAILKNGYNSANVVRILRLWLP